MNKKEIKKLINENVYWQMSVYKLRKIKKIFLIILTVEMKMI